MEVPPEIKSAYRKYYKLIKEYPESELKVKNNIAYQLWQAIKNTVENN